MYLVTPSLCFPSIHSHLLISQISYFDRWMYDCGVSHLPWSSSLPDNNDAPFSLLATNSKELWYVYVKTIAEKDAWRIAKEIGIDLVVVNPSFVVDSLFAPQPTSTLQWILTIVKGLVGELPNTTVGFVHIDDVVAAHILAMKESKALGRLICSSSVAHWSDIIHILRTKYPSYPYESKCSSKVGDNNPHNMDKQQNYPVGAPSTENT